MRFLFVTICLALASPVLAQSPQAIVKAERALYPTPIPPDQIAVLLQHVASRLNAAGIAGGPFGVLKKAHGSNCAGWSCDVICSSQGASQRQWDVLSDSEGAAKPTWHEITGAKRIDTCVIVPASVTDDEPPPPDPDLTEIRAELDLILDAVGQIQQTEAEQTASINRQEQALLKAIQDAQAVLEAQGKQPKANSTADRVLQILVGLIAAIGAAR